MSIISHHLQHAARQFERLGKSPEASLLMRAARDIETHGQPCADGCIHQRCPYVRIAVEMADRAMGVLTV